MIKIIYKNKSSYLEKSRQTYRLPIVELSVKLLRNHNIKNNKIYLKFGRWVKEFGIVSSHSLGEEEILLEKEDFPFDLPDTLSYEIKINQNTIHIGPIIAFIASKNANKLLRALEKQEDRFKNYKDIGGIIFACAADSIHSSKELIEGYYYLPDSPQAKFRWKKGMFPFPDCIFKKLRLPFMKENKLVELTNHKLFNTNAFTKLDLWNALSPKKEVRKYLPFTQKFESMDDLKEMLLKFETVYVKPISGSKGNGIFLVRKKDDGSIVIINNQKESIEYHTLDEVVEYLKKNAENKTYIIQQGIPIIYKNKHVDFRFYFQKDQTKEWICQGVVGRVAQEGSIITNLHQIAHLKEGQQAIKIVFKVNEQAAIKILDGTVDVCKEICSNIDQTLGHFGDIAIDVIIDENKWPWILEINNGYGTKSLDLLRDQDTLEKLKITPFFYAKRLAGF